MVVQQHDAAAAAAAAAGGGGLAAPHHHAASSSSPLNYSSSREFEHILIDLDDCLYRSEEVPAQVRELIQRYVAEHLGVPADEVAALTQELYATYGTTMSGLAARGFQLDADHWHRHVHAPLDYDALLGPQPETRRVLARLPLQKHLLTNADAAHAAACLERLGIADCFHSVFCFENVQELGRRRGALTPAAPILCKPSRLAYEVVLDAIGASPAETIFIDDSLRNVAAAHDLGIFSVLVSPALAARERHVVPGVDLVVPCFEALEAVLPGIFAPAAPPPGPSAAAAAAAAAASRRSLDVGGGGGGGEAPAALAVPVRVTAS